MKLLVTAGTGFSATSDSLLVLASLRRALGEPNTLNERALWARSILASLAAAQQLSSATWFTEIAYVPTGRNVRLHDSTATASPREVDLLTAVDAPYPELIRRAGAHIAGALRGLGDSGATVELALSGGYDSRAVLAAAHRAGLQSLVCTSGRPSAAEDRDYEVAQTLASAFGFSFGDDSRALHEPDPRDRLTLWGATLAGVYDGFGATRSVPWHNDRIVMTGMGAEVGKGIGWGWRRWSDVVGDLPGNRHNTPRGLEEFLRAGHQGLRDAGYRDDDDIGSQLMYLAYRSGIHGSAGQVGHSIGCLSPLQSPDLTRAGTLNPSDELISDLTMLLCPEMVTLEYDRPERTLSRSTRDARLAELGGTLRDDELVSFTVDGSRTDLVAGPTQLGLAIAREVGFRGEYAEVLDWLDDDLDLLPPDLRPIYREASANGLWWANRMHGGALSKAGPGVAKAASLRLLRLLSPGRPSGAPRSRRSTLGRAVQAITDRVAPGRNAS